MSKHLIVSEMFKGIQGEGFHAGRQATFVRFSGCNLRCEFCDTVWAQTAASGGGYQPRELADKLLESILFSDFMIFTGGEPLLQDHESLTELIRLLKVGKVKEVAVETNGTVLMNKDRLGLDWVTISPKTKSFFTDGDELKLVIDNWDVEEFNLKYYENMGFKYYYLQPALAQEYQNTAPLWDIRSAFAVVFELLRKNPKWRLSCQIHKILGQV